MVCVDPEGTAVQFACSAKFKSGQYRPHHEHSCPVTMIPRAIDWRSAPWRRSRIAALTVTSDCLKAETYHERSLDIDHSQRPDCAETANPPTPVNRSDLVEQGNRIRGKSRLRGFDPHFRGIDGLLELRCDSRDEGDGARAVGDVGL
jgi:hypothetical protein